MMRQLSILMLTGTLLSGCTPAIKEVITNEWNAIKSFNYGKTAKQVSGWSDAFPEPMTVEEDMYSTYCINSNYAGERMMLVTGISEKMTYGGCILDAPAPYEAHRLVVRP